MAASIEEDLSTFCNSTEERLDQFWQIRKALRPARPAGLFHGAWDLIRRKGATQKKAKDFIIRKGMHMLKF